MNKSRLLSFAKAAPSTLGLRLICENESRALKLCNLKENELSEILNPNTAKVNYESVQNKEHISKFDQISRATHGLRLALSEPSSKAKEMMEKAGYSGQQIETVISNSLQL